MYAKRVILPEFYMNIKTMKRCFFLSILYLSYLKKLALGLPLPCGRGNPKKPVSLSCLSIFCSFFSILLFFSPSYSEYFDSTLQLGVEPEMGQEPVIHAIDQAKQSIDLAMYLFTDKKIAAALKRAAARGVTVHVLLERAPYKFDSANHWLNSYWHDSSIVWHSAPASSSSLNFLHEKILLIDHHQAWIMTFNFVYSSFSKKKIERNFFMLDTNPIEVEKLTKIFAKDWVEENIDSSFDLLHSAIALSPLNTRQKLQQLITQAKSQIKIYAEGLDDDDFIHALAQASRRGVSVYILHQQTLNDWAQHYLIKHDVILKQPSCFTNHAKAIIVDNQLVYVGSANFTYNSFMHNREVGMVFQNQNIAGQLSQQFDRDWRCAVKLGGVYTQTA